MIQAGQGQNISQILSGGNVQTTQAGRIIVNQGGAQTLSSIGGQQLRLVQRQGPNGQVQYVMASQAAAPSLKSVPVYQNASGATANISGAVQGSPAILGNQKVQIVKQVGGQQVLHLSGANTQSLSLLTREKKKKRSKDK